jgi:hypothetical protein
MAFPAKWGWKKRQKNLSKKWSLFSELEEMLFAYYFSGHAFKSNDKWGHTWGHLKNGGDRSQPIMSWHPTAAQARAEMLIHLLQGGSLSAGQVNERLFENNTQ